jgi:hypothetical protein
MAKLGWTTVWMGLLLATGCVIAMPRNDTGPIRERSEAGQGMIVGNLRYPGHEIQGVVLYEDGTSVWAMEPRGPHAHVFPNGDFVFENLKPVPYRLLCYYSGGTTYALLTRATKDDPRFRFEVHPGKVTYVGSYVTDDGVNISRTDRPSLNEILAGVLPRTTGTYWESSIREHLAQRR